MNDDVYVRNDVFAEIISRIEASHEATVRELRALNEASEARHKEYCARQDAQIAEIRADVNVYREESRADAKVYREESRRESESLAADIRGIKDRLDDIKTYFGVMGFAMTFSAIAIAAVQVWLAIR